MSATSPADSAISETNTPINRVSRSIDLISKFVAPVALITACFTYIGWVRTRAFFSYLGISPSLISLSPQDYILRSTDVSLGGVLILLLAAVLLLGLDWIVSRALVATGNREPALRTALASLGVILVLAALIGALSAATSATTPPMWGALLLATGAVALLRFGKGSRPNARPGLSVVSAAALVLAGFWGVSVYAQQSGERSAAAFDTNSDSLAVVTIYSREPLDFPGSNIRSSRVTDPNGQWTYRYTGARLLVYSNSRWFLISDPASSDYHVVVATLADGPGIRIDTTVPRTSKPS